VTAWRIPWLPYCYLSYLGYRGGIISSHPDKSEVIDAIRKHQRSKYGKQARTVTLCVHFLTCLWIHKSWGGGGAGHNAGCDERSASSTDVVFWLCLFSSSNCIAVFVYYPVLVVVSVAATADWDAIFVLVYALATAGDVVLLFYLRTDKFEWLGKFSFSDFLLL
jgi:hypothetical protein